MDQENTPNEEAQVEDVQEGQDDIFYDPNFGELTGQAKPAKAEKAEADAEDGEDDAEVSPAGDKEAKPAQPKDKGAARSDYLAREARREAREAKALLEEYRRELEEVRQARAEQGGAAKKADGPPKPPNPKDFTYGIDDDKYLEAQVAYQEQRDAYVLEQAETRALERYEQRLKEQSESERIDLLTRRAQDLEQKGLDKYEDFADAIEDAFSAMPLDVGALQSLALQDGAEDVLYHLAKSPQALERLTGMDPMAQAFEMGRMASQFAARREGAAKTKVSKAAPTPTQPRGANGQYRSSEDALYDRLMEKGKW